MALSVLIFSSLLPVSTRAYRSEAFHVRLFQPPPSYSPAPPSTYVRILALFTHPSGARLTLAAERVAPGGRLEDFVAKSRTALEHQGFRLQPNSAGTLGPHASIRVFGTLVSDGRVLRQLYVLAEPFAYVITLIGPGSAAASLERDFEESVASFTVDGTTVAPVPR